MKFFSIGKIKKGSNSSLLRKAFAIICALLCSFVLTELYNDNYVWTMDPSIIGLNLYVYALVCAFVLLFSDSAKAAGCATLFVFWFFSTANHYVFVFRGSPLRAADIFSASTAADVAGHYSFAPDAKTVALTAAFIVCIFICRSLSGKHIISGAGLKKDKKEKSSHKHRIIRALVCTGVISYVIFFFFFSGKPEKRGMSTINVDFQNVYKDYGSALTFMLTIKDIIPRTPQDYSEIAVNDIVSKYETGIKDAAAKEQRKSDSAEPVKKPNVIAIVNESFSDLQRLGNVSTNEDSMSFLHSLSDNTIQGTAYASVFGGNTANSEFEFLTGNTMAFQAPGSVVFQSLSGTQESIVKAFERNGYTCLNAYHPGKRKSWNRVPAYESLGFKEFYDATMFDRIDTIRGYADDDCLVDEITGQYDSYKGDAPVFIYAMSIQNHGGYESGFEDLDKEIEITDPAYENESLELYLNLIRKSDEAFEKLTAYFEKCDDPTVIIMFGDHQPKLEGDINDRLVSGDGKKKYEVPFYIWANYDIDEQTGIKTSINYLGSRLLKLTGNDMSGYEQYLLEISGDIPVITANGYWGSDGNYYELKDEDSPYYEKITEYNYLQYANMYDRGTAETFFND